MVCSQLSHPAPSFFPDFYPFHNVTPGRTSLVFEVSRPFGARVTQGGFQVVINDSFKGILILCFKKKEGSFETKQAFSAE